MVFSGCALFTHVEPSTAMRIAKQKMPYDVIIVPGLPADTGSIHPILSDRIKWAAFLYKNGYTKHVIFSGSAVYSPYFEGEAMRLYAIAAGIPAEVVYPETRAEHTSENIYYSYLIAKQKGFKTMAFASQAAQTNPIKGLGDKLDIDMLPIVLDSIKDLKFAFELVDITSAYKSGFVALPERESLLKRLRGTMGYRVKADMRKTRREARKSKHKAS